MLHGDSKRGQATPRWIPVSLARLCRVGAWCAFVRSALLLAFVLCWDDCCFDAMVLLGFPCFLHVTQLPQLHHRRPVRSGTGVIQPPLVFVLNQSASTQCKQVSGVTRKKLERARLLC